VRQWQRFPVLLLLVLLAAALNGKADVQEHLPVNEGVL
jgi:hypothetical protein